VTGSRWDAIVIGAGPAGSTAARCLAEWGRRVLLVDRAVFPRDKVCGDALIPDAQGALGRAGLLDQVRARGYTASGLSVYSPSNIRVDLEGRFVTLRRMELDDLIRSSAVDRGAAFRVARAVRVASEPAGGATVEFADGGRECAPVAVIATGADVTLAEDQRRNGGGAEHTTRERPGDRAAERQGAGAAPALALRCYVHSSVEIPSLVISFSRRILPGYAWIFPLGAGWYNVGCGAFQPSRQSKVNLRRMFETFTATFPLARQLFAASSEHTPLAGARLRCGLAPEAAYRGGSVVAVGESVDATYPFTGEGIGKAMESAEIAASVIHEALAGDHARLADLPDRLRSVLGPRYEGYRVAERWIARAWLTDLVALRVRSSVFLRRAAARVLDETADPRQVFSWRVFLPRWAPFGARS
jgi:flavin-dependent dehydrogenase